MRRAKVLNRRGGASFYDVGFYEVGASAQAFLLIIKFLVLFSHPRRAGSHINGPTNTAVSSMLSAGYCALVLEIFLFMVVAARCWWELLGTSPRCALLLRRVRGRPQDLPGELVPTEEGESGSGVGARRSVQGMVAVACTARAGIIAFMLVHGGWVPYVALPDLVYLATYGFLVVFLAQMQQIVVGNRYLWVKIATSASLATVLVVSLIVCTARWGMEPLSNTSVLLRKFLYYELGVT